MAKYVVYLFHPTVGATTRGILPAGTIDGVLDEPVFINKYNSSPELKQMFNIDPRDNFICAYIGINQVKRYQWALGRCRDLLFQTSGWQLDEYSHKRIAQKVDEPVTPEELSRVQ